MRIPNNIYREIQTVSSFKELITVTLEEIASAPKYSYITPTYIIFNYIPVKIACYLCTKYYVNKYTKPLNKFTKRVSMEDMKILKEAEWSNIHSMSDTDENYYKIKDNSNKAEAIKVIIKFLAKCKNKVAMNMVNLDDKYFYLCPLVSSSKADNKLFNNSLSLIIGEKFYTEGYFKVENIYLFQEGIKSKLFNKNIEFEPV